MTARRQVRTCLFSICALFVTLSITACIGSSGGGSPGAGTAAPVIPGATTPVPSPAIAGEWTWISGSSSEIFEVGIYGTQGSPSNSNDPGARVYSTGWTDNNGNLWLFGGKGDDRTTTGIGPFNDLWEFNPTAGTWTWISGNNVGNIYGQTFAPGVYGTKGVPAASNIPLARYGAVGWKDASGNLWLFGGSGYTSKLDIGDFNDLWEFNITTKQWTWVSGSNESDARGVYGTRGVASPSNTPGVRTTGTDDANVPVAWTDKNGNFWLFGGRGVDGAGQFGDLNDLWEFNPTTKMWTWISGDLNEGGIGVFGTQGVASPNNTPGARSDAVGWTDNNGTLWLFGGSGPALSSGWDFGDLWKFDPSTKQWTWVNGSQTTGNPMAGTVLPSYGTQGVPSATNTPGGRDSAVGWVDSSGNLWLFGGYAREDHSFLDFNDLWKFSPVSNQWTWISGTSSNIPNLVTQAGIYGTKGIPAPGNAPGYRGSLGMAVAWTDSTGTFWLFGGFGNNSIEDGYLNDLWRYKP